MVKSKGDRIMLKLMRDIRSAIGQFVSLVIVLALGCFFFAGMLEASQALDGNVKKFYIEQNFADLTGVFLVADDWALESVKAVDGVNEAEGRYIFNTTFTKSGGRYDAMVYTLTDQINKPLILEGTMPKSDSECMIDITYAKNAGIKTGDKINLFMPEVRRVDIMSESESPDLHSITQDNYTLEYTTYKDDDAFNVQYTVSALYKSPEMMYKINPMDATAKAADFAGIIIPHKSMRFFKDGAGIFLNGQSTPVYVIYDKNIDFNLFNQIIIDGDVDMSAAFAAFDNPSLDMPNHKFAVFIDELSYTRADDVSNKTYSQSFNQIQMLVFVLPLLFFLVAAVITFISLSKMVDIQRGQIGIMQGMGIGKSRIYGSYILYGVFAALFGSLIGGILGVVALPYVYHMIFMSEFIMPAFQFSFGWYYIILGAVIAMGVASLAAFVSCHRTLKEAPAQAMRPKPAKTTKQTLLERWNWFWRKLNFGGKIMARNLAGNKLRVLLSAVGVMGGIMLLMAGIGIKDRVTYIAEYYDESMGYDFQILTDAEYDSIDEIAAITGGEVTLCRTAAGKIITDDKKSDNMQIQCLPYNSQVIKLYDTKGEPIFFDDNSLILPHILSEELKAAKGDTVTIAVTGYGQKTFTVTDVSLQYALPMVYCGKDVFDGMNLPSYSNLMFLSGGDDAIDKLNASGLVRTIRTRGDMKNRIVSMAGLLDMFIAIVVVGAAALSITVIFNITAINLYERSREIATLMVLGYRRFETSKLIIGENLVVAAVGSVLGMPLGYALFRWLVKIISSMNISVPTTITLPVYLISVAAVFAFTLTATLLLLRRMLKINMVEALKSVE